MDVQTGSVWSNRDALEVDGAGREEGGAELGVDLFATGTEFMWRTLGATTIKYLTCSFRVNKVCSYTGRLEYYCFE